VSLVIKCVLGGLKVTDFNKVRGWVSQKVIPKPTAKRQKGDTIFCSLLNSGKRRCTAVLLNCHCPSAIDLILRDRKREREQSVFYLPYVYIANFGID
jgi:hypothetical protein